MPLKSPDHYVVHGGGGGYVAEMLMTWLLLPCHLLEKARLRGVVQRLASDSSIDGIVAIVLKIGHLWELS